MNMSTKRIVVVLGPTASGKSDLAVKLAKKYNGEIISADSRQVYRGLDIGSGKVPRDLIYKKLGLLKKTKLPYVYKDIVHHLLDVASPKRIFTVAQYQKLARKAINKILAKGKTPIICGGTGFYIDSLIYDLKLPAVPPNKKLRRQMEQKTTAELFQLLQKLDPRRTKNIDKYNRRRLIRALEIVLTTKKPVPPLKQNNISVNQCDYQRKSATALAVLKIGVKKSPEELKKLIAKRLHQRLKQGMIEEVENLRKQGVIWKRLDDLGLECRYISRCLRGLISKKTMVDLILKESWFYAKRQMTWFKRDKNIHWIKNPAEAGKLVKKFLEK